MKILQLQTTKQIKNVDFYGNVLNVAKGSAIVVSSPHNYLYNNQCSQCAYTYNSDKCSYCLNTIDSQLTVDFISKNDFIAYTKGHIPEDSDINFECSVLIPLQYFSELLHVVGGKLKYYKIS